MTTFTFGKYKGRDVDEIICSSPFYVKWCLENVSFFSITDEQKKKLDNVIEEIKLEAMERDSIRCLMRTCGLTYGEAEDYIDEEMFPPY